MQDAPAIHALDVLVLVIYLVGTAALGISMARRVKRMEDYVLPRRFGKVFMTFFAFGTGTQSDQAVSVAAKSYVSGVSGIWYQWLWLFCTPFYWMIAPLLRRMRALTMADVFEARYDRSVSLLYALVGLLQGAINIGVMLKASAAVIEASSGGALDAELVIPVMTVLFVAYGAAGGLGAAVVTDFVQGLLTIVFSFVLLPWVLMAVGGMAGLHVALPDGMLDLVAPSDIDGFYIAMLSINGLVGIVAQPQTLSNCAAGRTELDGQVGFMVGNFIKRFCTVAWTLTGVAAISYFAGSPSVDPDSVFGRLAYEILPGIAPGLLGLFLAGILAAVMSTCDAFMVATGGLFAENIYKPLRPGRGQPHYLWAARAGSVVVVTGGVAFAYWLEDVVSGLEIFWKSIAMLGIAFWLGLFWRRMNAVGAWASASAAFAAWWLTSQPEAGALAAGLPGAEALHLVTRDGGELLLRLPWQMATYLAVGTGAGIVGSLLTAPTSEEQLERFYALVRTPVAPDEPAGPVCALPAGVPAAPARKLLPVRSLEIYVPGRRLVLGFVAGWLVVAAVIASLVVVIAA